MPPADLPANLELPPNLVRRLDELAEEMSSIEAELGTAEAAANPRRLRELSIRRGAIVPIVDSYREWQSCASEYDSNSALAAAGKSASAPASDRELAELAREELPELAARMMQLRDSILATLVTSEDRAIGSLILEVRQGVGGDEAALFAGDLLQMYQRFAQRRGWKWDEMEVKAGDVGGISQAIIGIAGPGAWQAFGYEGGTHQVKRVPATEAQGRVHTSTATVAVLPEPEEVESAVDPEEVKEIMTTAQGPGGQNVNKVATAVHLIHLPTGLEVRMQETRSQTQNREKAWKLLRARVYERRQAEANARRSEQRASIIGSGGRAEKIRTYRWKENVAVDHRLEESFNLQPLLAGDLASLVDALSAFDIRRRVEAL